MISEVIAGKGDDGEPLLLVFALKCLEAFVLLGEAAFGGGIDDEHDLALVVGE